MRHFLENLTSIYWWVSVVITGFLINILSVYIARRIDTRLEKVSSWRRVRSERKRSATEKEVERLAANPHEQIVMLFRETRSRLYGLMFLQIGFLAIFVAAAFGPRDWENVVILFCGFISITMSMWFSFTATDRALLVLKARGEKDRPFVP